MENKTAFIEPLLEKVEEYGRTSFDLLKFRALDKAADSLSIFASRAFALFSIFIFLFIANIGLALWLGDILGKTYYGFFCVAGFYGILGLVLYFFTHHWMKKQISSAIIKQVLN